MLFEGVLLFLFIKRTQFFKVFNAEKSRNHPVPFKSQRRAWLRLEGRAAKSQEQTDVGLKSTLDGEVLLPRAVPSERWCVSGLAAHQSSPLPARGSGTDIKRLVMGSRWLPAGSRRGTGTVASPSPATFHHQALLDHHHPGISSTPQYLLIPQASARKELFSTQVSLVTIGF